MARQRAARERYTRAPEYFHQLRRPKHLFSGLIVCGICGGSYTLRSHDRLTCATSRTKGTCTNRGIIDRREVEARVLRAIREELLQPGYFAEFCDVFTAEMNRLRSAYRRTLAGRRRELSSVDRQLHQLVQALNDGVLARVVKAEIIELEQRKARLAAALVERQLPTLHPRMAEHFGQTVTALSEGLSDPSRRAEAVPTD